MSREETLTEFQDYYKKLVNASTESLYIRRDKLRVSGFPYCGLRHVYMRLYQPTEYSSCGATYYTEVGKATHSALQDVLGLGGRMYGNWRCTADGCQGERIFYPHLPCPACGGTMEYVECILKLQHLFPHLADCLIDGIYRNDVGKYYVVDYKTSSVKNISLAPDVTYLPYGSNVAQVKAYCALIERRFRITIEGWILHYVARDNPLTIYKTIVEEISREEKAAILRKILRYSEHYGLVMNCTSFDTIRLLFKQKPCKTVEDYNSEFKSFEGCPLSPVCFEKDLAMERLRHSWKEREPDFLSRGRPSALPLPKL